MNTLKKAYIVYRQNGVAGLGKKVLNDPTAVKRFFTYVPYSMYHSEFDIESDEFVSFLNPILSDSSEQIRTFRKEIREDEVFSQSISTNLATTIERPSELHNNWRELLYVIVRSEKPKVMVEAGVYDGLASAYILRALYKNERGNLISIDKNDKDLFPTDISNAQAGWVIPGSLKDYWDLKVGNSTEILPTLAEKHDIDLFLDDTPNELTDTELSQIEPGLTKNSLVCVVDNEKTDIGNSLNDSEITVHSIMRSESRNYLNISRVNSESVSTTL